MPFVFYDTETTGTNVVFDQILQFAAILTDDNLREVDRFETRCRILPWIVPAPAALSVTRVTPEKLLDPALPSHYEMMRAIHAQLDSWAPAKFVGYNSMQFDEPMLQRGFWQTLHYPWLTVANGNSRFDVLRLVQAASFFVPKALSFPVDQGGSRRFKLSGLAKLNGFAHQNAHDALNDVEATLHVARRLAERAPVLWQKAIERAPKNQVIELFSRGKPVALLESFGKPSVTVALFIANDPLNPSSCLLARLDADWSRLQSLSDLGLSQALRAAPWPIISIATNKAPPVFAIAEVETICRRGVSARLRSRSQAVSFSAEAIERIVRCWARHGDRRGPAEHLEQTMHDGFFSHDDQKRMKIFHASQWPERAGLIRSFDDQRLRQLAQRLVYANAPQCLDFDDKIKLDLAISKRLLTDSDDKSLWRTIPAALKEFAVLDSKEPLSIEIRAYIERLEMKLLSNAEP